MSGKYWTRTLIGLLIVGASFVAISWGLYHVVRTGSCGSTQGGIVAPPCPPGTGLHIIAMIAGVFAALGGIAVYATRGPGGRPSRVPLGVIAWSLLFCGVAASLLVAAFGPAADPESGAKGVAIILGVIFFPMGLLPLFAGSWGGKKRRLAAELMATGKRCPGEVVSVEDTNVTINDNPHVRITVRAEPPGEPPFTIVKTVTVSRVAIPRRGDRCTVFYDAADRENRNGITFDPVPGMDSRRRITPPEPVSAPADDDEDPLAKIERLGELRSRGLITQAEFDEQKRRLLGEV